MEDRALYHSILAAPHDDAPRLVYADWLDDRAASEPDLAARRFRTRAELIRVQVALARSGPGGWKRDNPRPPELVARERRLLFRIGRKVRGEVPVGMASAPFDRGFLRPFRALRPHEFLAPLQDVSRPWTARFPYRSRLPELLPDGADPWNAAPLWDVHLFASTWAHDPEADTGQYGPVLDEVGQSARMERVGWLKVSFARTPVLNFLRHGRFPNVETLVLNSGPFPAVLHAVSANDSFRCLRYVQFGDDEWLWAPTFADRQRFRDVAREVHTVNQTEPAFGAMPAALARVLGVAPLPVTVPPLAELQRLVLPPASLPLSRFRERIEAEGREIAKWFGAFVFVSAIAVVLARAMRDPRPEPAPPQIKFDSDASKYQLSPEVLKALNDLERATEKPRARE